MEGCDDGRVLGGRDHLTAGCASIGGEHACEQEGKGALYLVLTHTVSDVCAAHFHIAEEHACVYAGCETTVGMEAECWQPKPLSVRLSPVHDRSSLSIKLCSCLARPILGSSNFSLETVNSLHVGYHCPRKQPEEMMKT